MGLAAPKTRSKLSQDPNNNNWSRSTNRFGHKVLTAQGWTPGQTLGKTESAYSEHYTAASASHIRVLLKDDFLGLGAKRGKAEGETFGLEVLSSLLGRLNGKSDGQLKKEEHARRDLKLMTYIGQNGKRMGFVSGGFLIGDKIERSSEVLKESSKAQSNSEKPSKKRKRSEVEAKESEKQKNKAQAEKEEDDVDSEVEDEGEAMRRRKEERGTRKEARKLKREEKRARKEALRLKRETKRELKTKEESPSSTDSDDAQTPNDQPDFEPSQSGALTPPASSDMARGRNVIRQRYIQQKRKSCMDQQALKEIFMIKSKT